MKINVTVKLRSHEDKVTKTETGYIVSITAAPIENKANIAVIKVLADHFNVPKSQVSIVSGLKSKKKIVEIAGAN
jgi:uncharacterized protein